VIFGAAALARSTPDDAAKALDLLLRSGINHIDTAASYGRSERLVGEWMPAHRDRFFLATKTGERSYEGAKAQFLHSLDRLHVRSVDHIQLHNLVDRDEWATALGPGGALEYLIEAREQGLTRFIGVTGHGVTVASMHLRSLERFPFDSVLPPHNYVMMQTPPRPGEELATAARARRGVANHQGNRLLGRERTYPGTGTSRLRSGESRPAVSWCSAETARTASETSPQPHVTRRQRNDQGRATRMSAGGDRQWRRSSCRPSETQRWR
jgi:hypothetical protein